MFYQTSGVRETRVRGGAAIWPNLRGRGGVWRAGEQYHIEGSGVRM